MNPYHFQKKKPSELAISTLSTTETIVQKNPSPEVFYEIIN